MIKPPAKSPAASKTPAKTATAPAKGAAPMPTPAPLAAVTNRFTDRFAPARHVAKALNEPADVTRPGHRDPKLAVAWKTKPGRELTEAELLAMPDSEYMNEKQLDFFRAKLQEQ